MKKLKILFMTLIVAVIALAVMACVTPVHTVTFDLNGGQAAFALTQEIEDGETISSPAQNPTLANHVFVEWRLDGTRFDFSTPITSNITLVAHFRQLENFTVTFDLNYGEAAFELTEQVVEGTTITAPTPNPTLAGHVFVEWRLNGVAFNFSSAITSNITLVAHYRPLENFTVTFDLNGGEAAFELTEQVVEGTTITAPTPNPTLTGHVFVEWRLNGVAFNFSSAITSNITLVAHYRPLENLTVTFDLNYGEADFELTEQVVEGTTITAPTPNPMLTGHVFVEWRLNGVAFNFSSAIISNITLVAHFSPLDYSTVTFDLAGGSIPNFSLTQTVFEGETVTRPVDPTRLDFVFVDWFVNGVVFDFSTIIATDITIVAAWTAVGLHVIDLPLLREYFYHDDVSEIDLTGGKMMMLNQDGTTRDILMTAGGVSAEFDFSELVFVSTSGVDNVVVRGTGRVVVIYQDFTLSFTVQITLDYHAQFAAIVFMRNVTTSAIQRNDHTTFFHGYLYLQREFHYITLSNSAGWMNLWNVQLGTPGHWTNILNFARQFHDDFPEVFSDEEIFAFMQLLANTRFRITYDTYSAGMPEYQQDANNLRRMYFELTLSQRYTLLNAFNNAGFALGMHLGGYYRNLGQGTGSDVGFGLGSGLADPVEAFRIMLNAQFFHDMYQFAPTHELRSQFIHSFENFLDRFNDNMNATQRTRFNRYWNAEREALHAFYNFLNLPAPDGYDWESLRTLSRELMNRNPNTDNLLYLHFVFAFLDRVDAILEGDNQEFIDFVNAVYLSDIIFARVILQNFASSMPAIFVDLSGGAQIYGYMLVREMAEAVFYFTTRGIYVYGINAFELRINSMEELFEKVTNEQIAQLFSLNSFQFYREEIFVTFYVLSETIPSTAIQATRAFLTAELFYRAYLGGRENSLGAFYNNMWNAMLHHRHLIPAHLAIFEYNFGERFEYLVDAFYGDEHRVSVEIMRIGDFMNTGLNHLRNNREINFFLYYSRILEEIELIEESGNADLIAEWNEFYTEYFVAYRTMTWSWFIANFPDFENEYFLNFVLSFSRVVVNRMSHGNVYWLTETAIIDTNRMLEAFDELTPSQVITFFWGNGVDTIFYVMPADGLFFDILASHAYRTMSREAAQASIFLFEAIIWNYRWTVEYQLSHLQRTLNIFRQGFFPLIDSLSSTELANFNAMFGVRYSEALIAYTTLISHPAHWDALELLFQRGMHYLALSETGVSQLMFVHLWITLDFEYSMLSDNSALLAQWNTRFGSDFADMRTHMETFPSEIFEDESFIFIRALSFIAFSLQYTSGYTTASGIFRDHAGGMRQSFFRLTGEEIVLIFENVAGAREAFLTWTNLEVRISWGVASENFYAAYNNMIRAHINLVFYNAFGGDYRDHFMSYMAQAISNFNALPVSGGGSQATFNGNWETLFNELRTEFENN
ncbi:MAG: InlB B-repeat-containing protein [Firmicutes bacterium]|nr:InlB B-repeat-containing protein [Bacillota bacterium]